MKNLSQRPPAAEPDMALLFLGSLFETLHQAPERDDAKLDALAMHILDEGPKTLLGLVIRARAEKWLRRHLWMLDFDSLSPSDQAARLVIDSAMRLGAPQACCRSKSGRRVLRDVGDIGITKACSTAGNSPGRFAVSRVEPQEKYHEEVSNQALSP
jgi:hypothetical protein